MLATQPPRITLKDERLTQREAAKLLGVSFPTCSRYMTKGRRGLKLPNVPFAGTRQTTKKAIDWWLLQLQLAEADERVLRIDFDEPDIDAALDAEGL